MIFLYDEHAGEELLRTLARVMSNPQLFNWRCLAVRYHGWPDETLYILVK